MKIAGIKDDSAIAFLDLIANINIKLFFTILAIFY